MLRAGAVSLLILASLFVRPHPARADITDIEFCNNFPHQVYIAIAYPQKNDDWLSRGWLAVATGRCDYYDSALHVSSFYYRAETDSYDFGNGNSGKSVWGDNGEKKLYVGVDTFDYLDPTKSFNSDSRLVGFSKFMGDASFSGGDTKATVTFGADGKVTYSADPADGRDAAGAGTTTPEPAQSCQSAVDALQDFHKVGDDLVSDLMTVAQTAMTTDRAQICSKENLDAADHVRAYDKKEDELIQAAINACANDTSNTALVQKLAKERNPNPIEDKRDWCGKPSAP